MAEIGADFPGSPSPGTQHLATNGFTYEWTVHPGGSTGWWKTVDSTAGGGGGGVTGNVDYVMGNAVYHFTDDGLLIRVSAHLEANASGEANVVGSNGAPGAILRTGKTGTMINGMSKANYFHATPLASSAGSASYSQAYHFDYGTVVNMAIEGRTHTQQGWHFYATDVQGTLVMTQSRTSGGAAGAVGAGTAHYIFTNNADNNLEWDNLDSFALSPTSYKPGANSLYLNQGPKTVSKIVAGFQFEGTNDTFITTGGHYSVANSATTKVGTSELSQDAKDNINARLAAGLKVNWDGSDLTGSI